MSNAVVSGTISLNAVRSVDIGLKEEIKSPNIRHIFSPPENAHLWQSWMMEASDLVEWATINGVELIALCGIRIVPTKIVTDGIETCMPCFDEMARIREATGE